MDMKATDEKRLLKMNEMDEIYFEAYKNAKLYTEKMKKCHDQSIVKCQLELG